MLPSGDGAQTVRRLRERGEDIPVLLLTARDETSDRIAGLELGADDYLTKPFDPRELLARIQTVLRRKKGASATGRKVAFGPYVFDASLRTLSRDGAVQELTSSELALVEALATHPNRKLSREQLLQMTHDSTAPGDDTADRAIDVAIFRLRRIVEDDPKRPRYIRTVWGVGYMFVPGGNAS
jgi:two-component system, OmpR family, phosphate regulon response regulator OmpR